MYLSQGRHDVVAQLFHSIIHLSPANQHFLIWLDDEREPIPEVTGQQVETHPTLHRSPVHHKTCSSLTGTYTHSHFGQREETRVAPYTTQPCGRPTPPLPEHVTYNTTAVVTQSTSPSVTSVTVSAMMSLRLPSEFFWHVNHDHGANLYLSLALTHSHARTNTHMHVFVLNPG